MPSTDSPSDDLLPARGTSLHYSLLFAAPDLRLPLAALHGLGREVAQIPAACSEPAVVHAKLAWWEEELSRLFANRPQHPFTRGLEPLVSARSLPREEFQSMVEGTRRHLQAGGFRDFDEQRRQAAQVGGAVARLDARIATDADEATLEAAERLGSAVMLTHQLRDLLPELRRGRLPLPGEALQRHDVTVAALTRAETAPGVEALLEEQAARIAALFAEALAALPAPRRPALRHQIILGRLHQTLLAELADEGPALLRQRTTLTPLRKLWIAWRTARAHRPSVSRGRHSR